MKDNMSRIKSIKQEEKDKSKSSSYLGLQNSKTISVWRAKSFRQIKVRKFEVVSQ